ncbi:MAG: ComEC/Rec2 family competence protein [Candidatus Acidiferrales bacterium]|jgi:competence protein ComEC
MRVPAVWIVAAFAGGILLRLARPLAPTIWLVSAAFLILLAALLLRFSKTIWTSFIAALIAWSALGGAAASLEHLIVPANRIARMVSENRLDMSEPLRWRGRLREDPLRLPWGVRYEMDLESVDAAGRAVAVTGGLRANYYFNPRHDETLPDVRAGDRVEALVHAHAPRNFMDPGAIDMRAQLAREGIDLTGTLRTTDLLQKLSTPRLGIPYWLARARGALLARLDAAFASAPEEAAILRAMLLGDRMFVTSEVSTEFQTTGAYHVLVVAGLHVGALCVFLLWLGRKLRSPGWLTALVTFVALVAYVGIVQDRPPILRAALMAAFYLAARPFFRRVELLNSVALVALLLLLWRPSELIDSSFQLSFLAAGVIAGLALPWIERTGEPYLAGLAHLGDVTRDASHAPKIAQFRLDLRAASHWLAQRVPAPFSRRSDELLAAPIRAGLRIWELVLLSFALQTGMMAMLALDFHRVTLAGPLSNVPAVFLTGLIVPLGYLMLGASFVWKRLADALAMALLVLCKLLLASVHWFAALPRASYRVPAPPEWLMIAWLAGLVALCALVRTSKPGRSRSKRSVAMRLQKRTRVVCVCELAVALVFATITLAAATHPFSPQVATGAMEVTVLDVGQGDSIFAAFPDGRTMLIDGGGEAGSEFSGQYRAAIDIGEEVVAPYLWSRGLKRIDVVALTHAHHDHLDGLRAVLNDFHVGQLWVGSDVDTRAYGELIAQARAAGVPVVHEHRGNAFDFGTAHGEVIWPSETSELASNPNNNSLVLRVEAGASRFLLAGDIEQKAENEILADGDSLSADILKVPHHGSKTSSTDAFLAAVAPRIAVISVGEGNTFGQPHPAVLERYQRDGVRVLRTDRDGAVTTISNARTLLVTTYRDTHPAE